MVFVGEWLVCDDGMPRPAGRAKVLAADGPFHVETFLVDSCADRTVFSASLLAKLQCSPSQESPGFALKGTGGDRAFVLASTVVEFTRIDGGPVHVRGDFAAFTDPAATDLSILGRDVLNLFDVIISRRRNEVLLVAGSHEYRVVPIGLSS